jgi:hypothetical protein
VIAPANVGKDKSNKKAVIIIAQLNKGIKLNTKFKQRIL